MLFLQEVCHWGWQNLGFYNCTSFPVNSPSASCLWIWCKLLDTAPVPCLPAAMLPTVIFRDSSSETVNKPLNKTLPFISCLSLCISSHQLAWLLSVNTSWVYYSSLDIIVFFYFVLFCFMSTESILSNTQLRMERPVWYHSGSRKVFHCERLPRPSVILGFRNVTLVMWYLIQKCLCVFLTAARKGPWAILFLENQCSLTEPITSYQRIQINLSESPLPMQQ